MSVAVRAGIDLQPLEPLFEVPILPSFDLPEELAAVYGGASGRLSLLESAKFLPGRTAAATLLTLRRAGSHLVLRYQLGSTSTHAASAA